MNFWVLVLIAAGFFGVRLLRPGILGWLLFIFAALYALLRFGFSPALPASVASAGLGAAVLCSALMLAAFRGHQFQSFKQGLVYFFTDSGYAFPSRVVLLLLPLLVGVKVYLSESEQRSVPQFIRDANPSAPVSIQFKDSTIQIKSGKNPFRELEQKDTAAFKEHLSNGKTVYYQNCVFCHGPDMNADGIFAHGFNPPPARFLEPGLLSRRTEPYLFWRIAEGPRMERDSGPWATSMPAYSAFLEEKDIWDVILYLYDYSNFKPAGSGN